MANQNNSETSANSGKKSGPLDGVKIVEFTSVVLGPWASQTLGDMGADIIKVEAPRHDSNRNMGAYHKHEDLKALYLTSNRNKRCIALDLKVKEGLDIALQLCKEADVILHNQRPQTIERLGLGYDAIKAINPKVIYCGSYGYAKDGPYGDKSAMDDAIQAASGLANLMEKVYGEPRYLPTVVADKTTAMAVVQGILAALFHRERTGEGQAVEVPMFETMVHWVLCEHSWGQTFDPPKGPAGYDRIMEKGRKPFKTKDGHIAMLPYMDHQWQLFADLAQCPELVQSSLFATMESRLKHGKETNQAVAKIVAEKTTNDWIALLKDTSIPHMRVNSLDDVFSDPHLQQTGFFETHKHEDHGILKMPRTPINFSKTPVSIQRMPPRYGQHSKVILQELGYDEETINSLLSEKTVQTPEDF
ncbi:CoA transferase [Temperatibacter marinus]|uniref:CoA transferase n=1 Tax=Temperatibacter marinus TaxID=1456591 RepID=A0AA52EIX1_9PROT|nr:CoA transferase [Temperatibacter marinus]WND03640.1 CoA transferase [Temperatibacter marinus]